jgi:hypothetical protein
MSDPYRGFNFRVEIDGITTWQFWVFHKEEW